MKYLLDTDHISILQRQQKPEYDNLIARMAQHPPADLAFSIISFHEQMLGCHTFLTRARTSIDLVNGYQLLRQTLVTYTTAPVVSFDSAAATVFDALVIQRVRIATMDLRIAAIALSGNIILLTRNTRDFSKVPGLVIEDWTV
jgi:tRNA(fMet)-specific endonuclease VapC